MRYQDMTLAKAASREQALSLVLSVPDEVATSYARPDNIYPAYKKK